MAETFNKKLPQKDLESFITGEHNSIDSVLKPYTRPHDEGVVDDAFFSRYWASRPAFVPGQQISANLYPMQSSRSPLSTLRFGHVAIYYSEQNTLSLTYSRIHPADDERVVLEELSKLFK
jgi:hypothetical protein